MSIYKDLITIEQALERAYELENSENQEEVVGLLQETQKNIAEQGLETLCKVRVNKVAEIDGIKAEIERLKERLDSKNKKLESLDKYISLVLSMTGTDKQTAGTFTVSFRQSVQCIVDEDIFNDERFITFVEVKKIDKMAIKDALKNGDIIQGARLQTNRNLNIK